jgi:hypothetical protein
MDDRVARLARDLLFYRWIERDKGFSSHVPLVKDS